VVVGSFGTVADDVLPGSGAGVGAVMSAASSPGAVGGAVVAESNGLASRGSRSTWLEA
jgi:hypothetical protein